MNSMTFLRIPSALAIIFSAAVAAGSADPPTQVAEFCGFGKVDLAQLANGDIKPAAGAPMSTARFLSSQRCFVVPNPPASVIAGMRRFDPTAHRELKVFLHS